MLSLKELFIVKLKNICNKYRFYLFHDVFFILRKSLGVSRLINGAESDSSPVVDYSGLKNMMATPRASPKADYTNVGGLKKLMKTPKVQKSPKADYTNVKGLKKIMATPKAQNSPKADYTNVKGLKKMMATPKAQNSPKADYTNVQGII